jgi:hypothetical protein
MNRKSERVSISRLFGLILFLRTDPVKSAEAKPAEMTSPKGKGKGKAEQSDLSMEEDEEEDEEEDDDDDDDEEDGEGDDDEDMVCAPLDAYCFLPNCRLPGGRGGGRGRPKGHPPYALPPHSRQYQLRLRGSPQEGWFGRRRSGRRLILSHPAYMYRQYCFPTLKQQYQKENSTCIPVLITFDVSTTAVFPLFFNI